MDVARVCLHLNSETEYFAKSAFVEPRVSFWRALWDLLGPHTGSSEKSLSIQLCIDQ